MIELLIINSLIIWGVYTSLQEGMIFEKIGFYIRGHYETDKSKDYVMTRKVRYAKYQIPEWIKKPLATCPICMASIYGTSVFWFAYFTDLINYDYIIIVYICYVFALAGLNYLILTFMPQSDE